jgi:adenylate cyclase
MGKFGRRLSKFFILRWVAFVVLALIVWLRVEDFEQVKFLRQNVLFDQFQQFSPYVPPEPQTAIIDIDEESIAAMGQWPWSRYDIAVMVQVLMQLGAKVVGFDVVFSEADRTSPDRYSKNNKQLPPELAEALAKLPSFDDQLGQVVSQSRVVLGGTTTAIFLDQTIDKLPKGGRILEENGKGRNWLPLYPYLLHNIPAIGSKAPGFGVFNTDPSTDGIVRRVPALTRVGVPNERKQQRVYPSLGIEMLRLVHQSPGIIIRKENKASGISSIRIRSKIREDKKVVIPTNQNGIMWVRFQETNRDLYVPAHEIIRIDPANQEKVQELYNKINGKYVLIGTSAEGLKDIRATPLDGAIPGVEVHSNIIDMIENDDFLIRPSVADAIELAIILVAGLILISVVPALSAVTTIAFFVPLAGILLGGSWYLYTAESLLLDGLTPAFALLILFVLLVYQKFAREQAQKKQVRGAFAQYLSPALVEQLAEDPTKLTLGGETRNMTFLFCDIRGFTPISESFKGNPQGLTALINKFLTPMTDIIMGNHGTIDKYMGDCIMAFWNAPLDDPEHPRHACESTLRMQADLIELNKQLEIEANEEGRKFIPIRIGIGVNTGECVVGNMGSEQRFDYSVLGDAVNLGARIEGQSKSYGVENVIGELTADEVPDYAILELDLIAVKGKDEAVRIFTMLGGPEMAVEQWYKDLATETTAMIMAYRESRFAESQAHLDKCRELKPDLNVLWDEVYQPRLTEYLENPPPEDWDGVYRATTK